MLANDPTQIMWIYCLSDMGSLVLSSPVVGKVSSSSKRLEPAKETGYDCIALNGNRYCTDEIMSADGTYGSSDPYVYWFTPEGQYFQWNGDYIVSSVPIKVDRPTFHVRDIDAQELLKAKKAQETLKAGGRVTNDLEVER